MKFLGILFVLAAVVLVVSMSGALASTPGTVSDSEGAQITGGQTTCPGNKQFLKACGFALCPGATMQTECAPIPCWTGCGATPGNIGLNNANCTTCCGRTICTMWQNIPTDLFPCN